MRDFGKTLLFLLLFSACNPVVQQKNNTSPNIILFMVDDMGWQDTSVPFWSEKTKWNRMYHTPNMERLAEEGMKFTSAYAQSICSPTRSSLMSGMNVARHRVTNWTLNKDKSVDSPSDVFTYPSWNYNGIQPEGVKLNNSVEVTFLPQILKDNGYFNIHVGKAHIGARETPAENPLNFGFDINVAGHAAGGPGHYWGDKNFGNTVLGKNTGGWGVPGLEKYHGEEINLTEALTIEAMAALDKATKTDQPFFLYMSHYGVHVPFHEDRRYYSKYIEKGYTHIDAIYASMIESMDQSLGDLMDYLKENDLEDNTIILFMSDNGGFSLSARGGTPHTHNTPLNSGKGSAYEGGIREPMLVKWPGTTEANSTTDQTVIIEDFFPTILEMAGVEKYETIQTVDGQSFTSMLKGLDQDNSNRSFYFHCPNNWGPRGPGIGETSTIRKGDWKLIYWHENQNYELFNLKEDIGETNNLAKLKPEIVSLLSEDLGQYLRKVNAQMPIYKSKKKVVPYPSTIITL